METTIVDIDALAARFAERAPRLETTARESPSHSTVRWRRELARKKNALQFGKLG